MVIRRIFFLFFLLVLACSKDKDEEPEYVVKNYDVSIETTEGGTVSYAGGSIQAGQTVTVNATPSDGYKFTGWSGDATGNENPLTLTVYSNSSITANFERIKYVLNVGVIGSGQVSQTVISSSKKGEEYNAGTVIRLNANPNSGSLFTTWSGSTSETTSEIDITIDGTKSVTATFEEQIFNLVNQDNVFIGTGRWKIRKPKTGDRGSGKSLVCEMAEVIFRADGTYTIVFSSPSGVDNVEYGYYDVYLVDTYLYEIILYTNTTQGTINNLQLTDNYITFTYASPDCNVTIQGDKDDTYDPSNDYYVCELIVDGVDLDTASQTISVGDPIVDIIYNVQTLPATICNQDYDAQITGLAPGLVMEKSSNQIKIKGSPSTQASGSYPYTLTILGALSEATTTTAASYTFVDYRYGTINIKSATASCTQASITLFSGNPNQTVAVSSTIEEVKWNLSTNCPADSNGVPLNSSASGLPSGVNYSFSGQNQQIILSGTPSSVGTYSYNIVYYNAQQLSNSSVVASVTGVFSVLASSTTSSTTCSADPCSITGALASGAQSLTTTVSTDSILVRYDFSNTCSQVLQASVTGLPPGVTYIVQEVDANLAYVQLRGIPTSVGNYNYTINVDNSLIATASAPACAATASTTISGSISVVASSTAAPACTISGTLASGQQTQTVTQNTQIATTTFQFDTNCVLVSSLQGSISNLPPGVNGSFSNHQATISGTPNSQASGTYIYEIAVSNLSTVSNATANAIVTGTIIVTVPPVNSNIYFENGICKCPNATAGDTAVINGTTYTAVDNGGLSSAISNNNYNLCTTLVTSMSELFKAKSVDGDITFWDTSNVTNMYRIFMESSAFNQDISKWDVSGIDNMDYMFFKTQFNQNISGWDVSNVNSMNSTFYDSSFNQPIGNWNTSNVTNMRSMFTECVFNQNIGGWDTSKVTDMLWMFRDAANFNQDLTGWCVVNVVWNNNTSNNPADFAANSGISASNLPLWGKEFSVALTSGAQSQTVSASTAITNIVFTATPICSGTLSANATGLPTGVTSTFNNNAVTISGTPNQSGTFNYSLAISGASTSQTVTGTITVSANATQSYTINVTAQNSSDYQLSGNDRNGTVTGNDPTVTIALGDTLNFNVDAAGHPFYLKTQAGTGTANQVSGATNQGTENGTVTWTPTATGTYYYICSLHGGMSGTIIVQ